MFNVDCKDVIEESSEILLKQLVDMNNGNKKIALSYSMGKDCLVTWHWLKRQGMTVMPFYFQSIKLDFIDSYINCHEEFFGDKINRITDMLAINNFHNLWGDIAFTEKYKTPKNFWKLMIKHFIQSNNCICYADGFKAADSIRRRMNFSLRGPYDLPQKRFSPLWNLNNKGVYDYVKKYQIPIPDSYLWHKRSVELASENEFYHIKYKFPKDYKKITAQWPRVEQFLMEDPKKPSLKNLDGCLMTGGFIFEYDDGKIKSNKNPRKSKLLTKNNDDR
jgi:hypothetical protein